MHNRVATGNLEKSRLIKSRRTTGERKARNQTEHGGYA
jgi:hypothetical protein